MCVKWFNRGRHTIHVACVAFFIWNTGIQKFGLLLDLLPWEVVGLCDVFFWLPVRYIARKRVEDTLSYDDLYVASLSPKTIVYKACWAVRVGKGCTWNRCFRMFGVFFFGGSTIFSGGVWILDVSLTGCDIVTMTAWNWMMNHRQSSQRPDLSK